MKQSSSIRCAIIFFIVAAWLTPLPASSTTRPAFNINASASVAVQPDIGVNAYLSADKAQRGRAVQAAVVLDIPGGYHVNSNRPLGKFVIPTTIKVEAPGGIRVGPVTYPRAMVRQFKFSEERLAVFEGRAVMRFNVTVPANFQAGDAQLRLRVRFQSCSDEVCFQPVTRDLTLPLNIVGADEPVRRVNGEYFGGRRGR